MKINIGGEKGKSNGPKGWTIVDERGAADIVVNIMESPLPLENRTVDAIYCSHTLEHIFPDKLPFVLSEWNRVLKKGAIARIVVPDIDKAIHAYVKGNVRYLTDSRNPSKLPCLPKLPIYYLSSWFFTYKMDKNLNTRMDGGHVNVFNEESLKHYLKEAGFKDIRASKYRKGSKVFDGWDFERYKDCSVYMEAAGA